MTPRSWIAIVALGSIFLMNGCRHCCKRQSGPSGRYNGPSAPGGTPFMGSPNLPPQNLPAIDPPPATGRSSPEVLLPTPPPGTSQYQPMPRANVFLGEPNFNPPAPAIEEKKPAANTPPPPPSMDMNPATPLPIGIASYAPVKDGITNGLRPDLDGLDWLQSNKTKTIVFLRSGKEDDSSDRRQVEKRGMTYKSIVVGPEAINAPLVAEFNQIANDASGRPLFVYDRDGSLAGAMWYLYFRTSESLNDEEARLRAGRFGFKEKGDAETIALWTAVQKYLAERQ